MTPAVISVLTNGLSCGESLATQNGTSLTAGLFTLWCGLARPGGGGGGVASPNNVSNYAGWTQPQGKAEVSYPQSDPDLVYINPNKVFGKRIPVTLKFKMGDKEVEKIYTVAYSKAEVLIKVMNWTSNKKDKMKATMSNLSRKHGIKAIYKRGRAYISRYRDSDE